MIKLTKKISLATFKISQKYKVFKMSKQTIQDNFLKPPKDRGKEVSFTLKSFTSKEKSKNWFIDPRGIYEYLIIRKN
jgi:hypothetical protein